MIHKCTMYTVSRCREDDSLYGKSHGADNDQTTLCGRELDYNWFITNNTFDGKITCKDCLKKVHLAHSGLNKNV